MVNTMTVSDDYYDYLCSKYNLYRKWLKECESDVERDSVRARLMVLHEAILCSGRVVPGSVA